MIVSFEEITGARGDREARRKAIVKASRALHAVPRATREAVTDLFRLCRARRRAVLIEQGKPAEHLFFVAEGRVRIERQRGDDVFALAHLGRGDIVGDLRLDPSVPAEERAIVADDVTALACRVSDVRELAARDPHVYEVICAEILNRWRMSEKRLEGLLLRRVDARLASFLLYAIERWGVQASNGSVVVATALRHHEISAMIGTGREWVTLTLLRLKRKRIVGVKGRSLVIRDLEALRRLAAGQLAL